MSGPIAHAHHAARLAEADYTPYRLPVERQECYADGRPIHPEHRSLWAVPEDSHYLAYYGGTIARPFDFMNPLIG